MIYNCPGVAYRETLSPYQRRDEKHGRWKTDEAGEKLDCIRCGQFGVRASTALIPVYFSSIATGSVVVAWGYAETIAALVIALTMPVLGSLADLRHMKKKFLVGTVGTGALACCALGLTTDAFLQRFVGECNNRRTLR